MAKNSKKTTDDRLDEIIKILVALQNQRSTDFNKLEKRMIAFEKSMDFINQQYETQKRITENLMKHNSQLESENKELRQKVTKLENNMNHISKDLDDLEQYGRRDSIEINGVSHESGEDTEKIAINIGKLLGIEFGHKDIQGCHRISPKPNAPIICKFSSRKLKDTFMKNRKELKRVDSLTHKLGLTTEPPGDLKIYINES